MKKIILTLCLFFAMYALAQQRPQFAHFMYNLSVVNPAYSNADKGVIDLGAFYRTQWTGVEGAPTTALAFAHGAIKKNIEAGVTILNDKIGNDINTFNANVDLSYVVKLNKKFKLSTGIKVGVNSYSADFNNVQLGSGNNATDPLFAENISQTSLGLGAGIFFFSRNFYFGASSPNLFGDRYQKEVAQSTGTEEVHYYVHSGYVHEVHEDLKIKPSFMVTAVENAPISVDIAANVLINKSFELGLGYNFSNTLNALFRYDISKSFSLGYSYGRTFNELSSFSNGSHEVFALFRIRQRVETSCFYDRFF